MSKRRQPGTKRGKLFQERTQPGNRPRNQQALGGTTRRGGDREVGRDFWALGSSKTYNVRGVQDRSDGGREGARAGSRIQTGWPGWGWVAHPSVPPAPAPRPSAQTQGTACISSSRSFCLCCSLCLVTLPPWSSFAGSAPGSHPCSPQALSLLLESSSHPLGLGAPVLPALLGSLSSFPRGAPPVSRLSNRHLFPPLLLPWASHSTATSPASTSVSQMPFPTPSEIMWPPWLLQTRESNPTFLAWQGVPG